MSCFSRIPRSVLRDVLWVLGFAFLEAFSVAPRDWVPFQLSSDVSYDARILWSTKINKTARASDERRATSTQQKHYNLGMGSANERRRYTVTSSHIGWAYTQSDPW